MNRRFAMLLVLTAALGVGTLHVLAQQSGNSKQEGQATVARRAPQCSQRVASLVAAAPHIGQFRVSAGITSPRR